MAYEYMKRSSLCKRKGDCRLWEYEGSLEAAGYSPWVIIPENARTVGTTLSFTDSGSGKLQLTTNAVSTVIAGTAVPMDWDYGEVTATTQDGGLVAPTAVRVQQVHSGKVFFSIMARD